MLVIDAEVRYAARHEYAQSAIDVIARRTRLSFLNAQAALEALPTVVDILGEEVSLGGSSLCPATRDDTKTLETY